MRTTWGFLNVKRVRAGIGKHKYVVTCGLHGGTIHYTSAHKSAEIANRYALKHEKEHKNEQSHDNNRDNSQTVS